MTQALHTLTLKLVLDAATGKIAYRYHARLQNDDGTLSDTDGDLATSITDEQRAPLTALLQDLAAQFASDTNVEAKPRDTRPRDTEPGPADEPGTRTR